MRSGSALFCIVATLVVALPVSARQWFAEDEARWRAFHARLQSDDDKKFQQLGFEPIQEVQAAGRVVRRLYVDDDWEYDLAVQAEQLADGRVRLIAVVEKAGKLDTVLPAETWTRITQNEEVVFPPLVFRPSPPGTPRPPPPNMCHGRSPSLFATGPQGIRHRWYYCGGKDAPPEVLTWVTVFSDLASKANGCSDQDIDYLICFGVYPRQP